MTIKLKKIDFYKIFTYFLILSFAGWIFETLSVLFLDRKLTDRGLLFVNTHFHIEFSFLKHIPFIWGLPIIPIYGFGGLIIVFCFKNLQKNIVLYFFVSMISMTLFELVSSYICYYMTNKQCWDYSNDFMNFQGRICLRSAIAWGILSIIVSKLMSPELRKVYSRLSSYIHYKIFLILTFIFLIFCSIVKYLSN